MAEGDDSSPRVIVFTAAGGPCAGLVIRHVAERFANAQLEVLSSRPLVAGGVVAEIVDLAQADLDSLFARADVVVHLGIAVDDRDPYLLDDGEAVREARAVIDAGIRRGVGRIVVVSSSLVLGAQPTNPVPMSESAVVRPEPDFRPAVELGEIERLVGEAALVHDASEFTILRTAPVVANGSPGWLASELHRSLAYQERGFDPELQFVHAADLGEAVATVIDASVSGVVQVAPDGLLTDEQRQALDGVPRLHLPEPAVRLTALLRSVLEGTRGPDGIRAYLSHPWVISNDRLRSMGWCPTHTNEEAYVAAFRPAPWSMMGSGRRQELVFSAVGLAAASTVVGVSVVLHRRRR